MENLTKREDINRVLWAAADSFRGTIDSSVYKDYILVMLFIKYLSDMHKEHLEEYMVRYDNNMDRVNRAMSRERFILEEISTFDYIYSKRKENNIGEIINESLAKIEEDNTEKLKGVFRNIDFNSESVLGNTKERNTLLRNLVEDFNKVDLSPKSLHDSDIIGDAYQYMIEKFASDAGKKGGEFFTPPMVSELLARIVEPEEGDRIYDPTCGSGSLLIRTAKKVPNRKVAIYGQEKNGQTNSLCKMNMFLNNIDDAQIGWGDTISNPIYRDKNNRLLKFNKIVANPPFSLDKWSEGFKGDGDGKFKMTAEDDPHNRFVWGVPPAGRGDMAFVQHMLYSLTDNGTMATILPHGVLFRGSSEKKIRKAFIDLNYLHAVIGLPEKLFYGTGIPACIMVFKKNRNTKEVLFIDASGEGNYEKLSNQNALREEDLEKIISTYKEYKTVDKYSYKATYEEIVENDYNLNIPRYVDTFEDEEPVDMEKVSKEIKEIKSKLDIIDEKMENYLKDLGL